MISTHILDTHLGKPAPDVVVRLFSEDGCLITEAKTNTDGRVSDFGMIDLKTGVYSLEFFTSAYFENLGLETFFPKAVIHFYMKDASQHFHIPLLISPFAYSTYRGS
ncbi:hydroxyisourate hydrolase [Acinetobacter sp.]|uniref:hydroxyisourate hydrolase n=1 Tax=Acinetobacter sp. TaxID=472 RepID=UPI003BAECF11